MHAEEIREYCLAKKAVEESFPFDNETLVFKVGGKIFLLMGIMSKPIQFNVKCRPDKAVELREKHGSIIPGYHMNKAHWNTVMCDGRLSRQLILEQIDESYDLIVSGLPKKIRESL